MDVERGLKGASGGRYHVMAQNIYEERHKDYLISDLLRYLLSMGNHSHRPFSGPSSQR